MPTSPMSETPNRSLQFRENSKAGPPAFLVRTRMSSPSLAAASRPSPFSPVTARALGPLFATRLSALDGVAITHHTSRIVS